MESAEQASWKNILRNGGNWSTEQVEHSQGVTGPQVVGGGLSVDKPSPLLWEVS